MISDNGSPQSVRKNRRDTLNHFYAAPFLYI